MRYKIQRTDHRKLTQGILRLCMMIDNYYYQPYDSMEECIRLLDYIYDEALETKFLVRNAWQPLNSYYNIIKTGDTCMRIESLTGKVYIEFQIIETD